MYLSTLVRPLLFFAWIVAPVSSNAGIRRMELDLRLAAPVNFQLRVWKTRKEALHISPHT